MKDKKKKMVEGLRNFWDKYGGTCIALGTSLTVGTLFTVTYVKGRKKAWVDGFVTGSIVAMDYLDELYPGESKAKELFCKSKPEDYKKYLEKTFRP